MCVCSAVRPQCWLCSVCAVGRVGCCVCWGGGYPMGVSISSSYHYSGSNTESNVSLIWLLKSTILDLQLDRRLFGALSNIYIYTHTYTYIYEHVRVYNYSGSSTASNVSLI